jgi:hypothetical protein
VASLRCRPVSQRAHSLLSVVDPDNESLRIRVEAEEGTYSAESERA